MKRAIIFDLNGVFIKSPYLSDRFQDEFGVDRDKFWAAFRVALKEVRKPGAKRIYHCMKPYFDEWGLDISDQDFMQFWFEGESVDQDMFNLAKELKRKGIKIYALSNNLEERTAYYMSGFAELMNLFDGLYFSWQTGFIKPDKRAWVKIIEDNQLLPKNCMYFDDVQENIDVASKLGIESFLFAGVEKCEKIINRKRGWL